MCCEAPPAVFFSKDELSRGNTDRSHKLNSLKLLVFAKFPVESEQRKGVRVEIYKNKN